MLKKHIICFGDSNTHGYDVETNTRFNEKERWPCLLSKGLGEEYLIIEEGLNGRTTVFGDPLNEGLSGIEVIRPCLMSHEPVDLLMIMLGTNDTKERFGVSAQCIGLGLKRLVQKAKHIECWRNEPNILIISPPPIEREYENQIFGGTMGRGCSEKAHQLAREFQQVAKELGCYFLDASHYVQCSEIDSVHLTKDGHLELAKILSEVIPNYC